MVVAHANTLRALIKHLDRISDEAIAHVEVPTARPLLYQLDAHMTPVIPGGWYLDALRGDVRLPDPAESTRHA